MDILVWKQAPLHLWDNWLFSSISRYRQSNGFLQWKYTYLFTYLIKVTCSSFKILTDTCFENKSASHFSFFFDTVKWLHLIIQVGRICMRQVREEPCKKNACSNGILPDSVSTPPQANGRFVAGIFRRKWTYSLKRRFWLWEWIFSE